MTQVETDVQILDRISSTVRKLVDKKEAPIAEAVVHAIVQSLPKGDLAAGDPEGLATGCIQFWRFGNERSDHAAATGAARPGCLRASPR